MPHAGSPPRSLGNPGSSHESPGIDSSSVLRMEGHRTMVFRDRDVAKDSTISIPTELE
jgi:hypothetical protein